MVLQRYPGRGHIATGTFLTPSLVARLGAAECDYRIPQGGTFRRVSAADLVPCLP
jgi:hypothetical protein